MIIAASPTPVEHAVKRGCDIVGADVDKQWYEYRCGPRHGKQEKQKRAKMLKKLAQNQEPEQ